MSHCKRIQESLDEYALGLGGLSEADRGHLRSCPDCRHAFEETKRLKGLLHDYVEAVDRRAEDFLEERTPELQPPPPQSTSPYRRIAPWIGIAAALLIAFLLGTLWRPIATEELSSPYLTSLESAATRSEILTYLGRSQMFLVSLFDGTLKCDGDDSSFGIEQEMARRLAYQKKLLEPKLDSPQYRDLKPLLDELELVLIEIAGTPGCLQDSLALWKEVLDSRSTLTKLELLQMEGRI